ncbi:TetR/AcrR family transcriptional regulator [Actinokineospora sp.]|uniref:TetR/AcrR family transcriptional regulator n=1 Tax=Actinokineospora sp. TaxID=1872133 RepID=UPI00403763F5
MTGDPRIARTRVKLRDALLGAAGERPLPELSVADVVRRAGVARATFYLHYDSLDALVVDTCADLVGTAVDALHAFEGIPDPDRPPPQVAELLAQIDRHAGVYRGLLQPGGGGPLGERLHQVLADRVLAERGLRGRHGPGEDVLSAAVAATFTGVLASWLHGRVSGTPDQIAERVWRLLGALHVASR